MGQGSPLSYPGPSFIFFLVWTKYIGNIMIKKLRGSDEHELTEGINKIVKSIFVLLGFLWSPTTELPPVGAASGGKPTHPLPFVGVFPPLFNESFSLLRVIFFFSIFYFLLDHHSPPKFSTGPFSPTLTLFSQIWISMMSFFRLFPVVCLCRFLSR